MRQTQGSDEVLANQFADLMVMVDSSKRKLAAGSY